MSRQHGRERARRLIAAANEMLAIARELERGDGEDDAAFVPPAQPDYRDSPIWGELARQAYRDRRRRVEIFGDDSLFGEPAWDILLDLFIAAKERKRVPVTSACIGSAVPATTGLRWIALLEQAGLVVREDDVRDARRAFLRLSSDAYAKMIAYFEAASRPERPAEEVLAPGGGRKIFRFDE